MFILKLTTLFKKKDEAEPSYPVGKLRIQKTIMPPQRPAKYNEWINQVHDENEKAKLKD